MSTDPLERHYKTAEVAELLSVCSETVLRLAARGELPSVRVGPERRYPHSGLVDYLRRHRDDEG
jgi:excisionase family DNA binding protein